MTITVEELDPNLLRGARAAFERRIAVLSRTALEGSPEVAAFQALGDSILANEGDVHTINMFCDVAIKAIDFALAALVSHPTPSGDSQASLPIGDEGQPVAWRDETDSEHIARDIKEGRFPQRSERQKRPAVDDAWERIRGDGELDAARRKLSMHELRRLIKHAVDAHVELAPALPHEIIAGWQPIETAPKDGTEVLLWLGSPWSKIEKARWYQPWLNWQIGSLPADPAREEEHYGIGSSLPTHWMPLPTPPARDLKGE